jgi:DNA polymerase-1
MSILEQARKTYARILSERNGHPETLQTRVPGCIPLPSVSVQPIETHKLIDTPALLPIVAAAIDNSPLVGLDLETTGLDPLTAKVRLMSLACGTVDGGRFAYIIDCFAVDPRSLFPALADKELVIHNAAFDLAFLTQLGFTPQTIRCTLLRSQLLDGLRRPKGYHTLKECCRRHLGATIDKELQAADWSGPLSAAMLDYAAKDVHLHVELFDALEKKIRRAGLDQAADIEERCLPAMTWLSTCGVAFDLNAWLTLADGAASEAEALREQLDLAAPPRPGTLPDAGLTNWQSPKEVLDLFHALGFRIQSTNDGTLAKIDHRVADLLRQYRSATKRVSTYGKDWQRFVKDGRIYPGWRQLGADSGRMACSDPNAQNLPRDPRYRACFIAPPGRVLVKADYSQIELRIAAKIAGDKRMIAAFQSGEDLHALTASLVLGKPLAQVNREDRKIAKSINFGLLYGMGWKGFRDYAKTHYGLDLSVEQAPEYRATCFRAYRGLRSWHACVESMQAVETRTIAGRRRFLDKDGWNTFRLNSPVQGTGADGLKRALALLWERRADCPTAFPVLVVHDEIVVEADKDQAQSAAAWLKSAMVDGFGDWLDPVPIEVQTKIATSWGG